MKSDAISTTGTAVLVCFAVKEEARPFRKLAAANSNVFVLVTGMGCKNAEQSVRKFLSKNSPKMVLTCGFAGALNSTLDLGAVIFSTDYASLHEELMKTNAQPAKIFCAERIAITVAEKDALRQSTGADAVEMESRVIQSICRDRGIPCATLRVISDTAREDLPLDFNQLSDPDMNLNYGKLAWAIVKSPEKIPALMQLQKNCQFAAEQISKTLAKIILR